MAKHPIQPLEIVKDVLRFKENALVSALLDHGQKTGLGMNELGRLPGIPREDYEQFAQLIGYSHGGAGDLGYVSDEVWTAAKIMYEEPTSELRARNEYLEDLVKNAREGMVAGIAELFGVHPDDLRKNE